MAKVQCRYSTTGGSGAMGMCDIHVAFSILADGVVRHKHCLADEHSPFLSSLKKPRFLSKM